MKITENLTYDYDLWVFIIWVFMIYIYELSYDNWCWETTKSPPNTSGNQWIIIGKVSKTNQLNDSNTLQ